MTNAEIRAYRLKHGLDGYSNAEVIVHATEQKTDGVGDKSIVHVVVMGELEVFVFSMPREKIASAKSDPTLSHITTDQVVIGIGQALSNPLLVDKLHKDKATRGSFVGMLMLYVSRKSTFELMGATGDNTLIVTVFKSVVLGGFQARVAGMLTVKDIGKEYKTAARKAVASNPMYLKDTYDPSSIYHTLMTA